MGDYWSLLISARHSCRSFAREASVPSPPRRHSYCSGLSRENGTRSEETRRTPRYDSTSSVGAEPFLVFSLDNGVGGQ